jgi:hypothetical protein
MFFRRRKKFASPIKGDDGFYYAEEGQEYDSEEYETDSEYSSEESSTNGSDDESYDASQDSKDTNNNEEAGLDECVETETANVSNEMTASPSIVNEKTIVSQACTIEDTKKGADGESQYEKNITMNGGNGSIDSVNDTSDQLRASETTDIIHYGGQTTSDISGDDDNDGRNMTFVEKGDILRNLDELEDSISLQEKRAVIALAAQHDRVDILKSILQPSPNKSDCAALAQLLLNNVITIKDGRYTSADLQNVFLPPLHIAIAYASANAASCLLRMGSNPSIRPEIPDDWEGPGWTDENGEIVIDQDTWAKFDGMSAWELAFGTLRMSSNRTRDVKRGWFGFRSSNSKDDGNIPELYIPVKIEQSKLEGIRHAFTAEALRAIGSDEVDRLKELLGSGIGLLEPVEIGGKDLYGWCVEMGAKQCVEVLKTYSAVSVKDCEDHTSDEGKLPETEMNQETPVDKKGHEDFTLQELQNKLEEMKALESALSSMVDNLAEEVSVTQGLLMQHGDDSNSALLSQVRQLKKQRAEIDDEITQWEGYVADRYAELDMVSIWWQKRGGALKDILNVTEQPIGNTMPLNNSEADEDVEEQVKLCSEKLLQTENKVKKLRSSISSLSKESLRNLQEVETLGLLGAVKLTRKLKDEMRQQKEVLESLIQEESSVKNKVKWIRHLLERSDATIENASNAPNPTIVEDKVNGISRKRDQSDQIVETYETVDSNSEYSSDDGEDGDESYDSTDTSDGQHESHSEAIRRGHSTAIVEWVDDGDLGIFTFKVWALFQRLVGPSIGYSIEESGSNVDGIVDTPRVIII